MLILAVETSTDLASCALWRDGETTLRVCPPGEPSSATLLPTIAALLDDAGVGLRDLDALAFAAGPGSFTGLRIACGVAQGLAHAAGIPVVAVGTLAALAEASGEARVLAVLDARMGEVYFGRFERRGEDLYAIGEPAVAPPAAVPLDFDAGGWVISGNALSAYPSLGRHCGALLRPEVMPDASAVATLGARSLRAGGGIAAAQAVPVYVRDKVAFTVAERLAGGGKA